MKEFQRQNEPQSESRRQFLKKTGYVVPVILTLNAVPALASQGSNCNNGVGNGPDCLPPGLEQNGRGDLDNDDNGGVPGAPQNQGGGH
jgi:hypothetical protein